MIDVISVLIIASLPATIAWLMAHWEIYTSTSRRIFLADRSSATFDTNTCVSIVVSARNEERNVESCVRSILSQEGVDFEVVAVDDRSEDDTLQILHRLSESCPNRMTVASIEQLEPGWCGKNRAMHVGVSLTRGEWLCFTDADCRFTSPDLLRLAIADARANEADFLSVIPTLEISGTWQQMIDPVCVAAILAWFPPDRVNIPDTTWAYANGAMMLIRRDCYQALRGHEAVAAALNEDIQLARLAKTKGFKLRVVESALQNEQDTAGAGVTTRMYDTPAESIAGWSRIFLGSLDSALRTVVSLLMLTLLALLPPLVVAASAMAFLLAPADQVPLWSVALFCWIPPLVLLSLAMIRQYKLLNLSPWLAPAGFAGVWFLFAIFCRTLAMKLGVTNVSWRGTIYGSAGSAAKRDAAPASRDTVSGTRACYEVRIPVEGSRAR